MELSETVAADLETGARKMSPSMRSSFMNRFVNVSRKSSANSEVNHPPLSAATSSSLDSTNLQVVDKQDAQLIKD